VLPLFPELRAPLHEVFEAVEPGEEWVITRYRQANCNLRTQFQRIIHRAGLKPWPRLFQNLRSSCATELVEVHPAHVVAAFLGHSVTVAQRHYLTVRDAHYDLAAGVVPGAAQNAAHRAAHFAAQHPAA
jgi:hypothetical protein